MLAFAMTRGNGRPNVATTSSSPATRQRATFRAWKAHLETVNGDLVFTPRAEGVEISGTRTDYPWMEVYQDMPDGSSRTVLIDPAAAGGALGPSTNLPFHHDVGIGGKAFAPFDTGGWNPPYDVPTPLPATAFGPVTAPPSVPSLPTGGTTQF